jgi:hypothetical protein
MADARTKQKFAVLEYVGDVWLSRQQEEAKTHGAVAKLEDLPEMFWPLMIASMQVSDLRVGVLGC